MALIKSAILVLLFNKLVKPWETRLSFCLYCIQWKRHPAHYLTGLSWLRVPDRVGVSILLLCFLSGICSMKTECGVYTVQFPASHVTDAQILEVKKLISLNECVYVSCVIERGILMCVGQPLLDSRQSAGRWTWWLLPGLSWLPHRLSEWRRSQSPTVLTTHTNTF